MIYLRNDTREDQWLEDPLTGTRRKIQPEELARVSEALAEHALLTAPKIWVRVVPIPLAAPPGASEEAGDEWPSAADIEQAAR